jgi:hypothetical protein
VDETTLPKAAKCIIYHMYRKGIFEIIIVKCVDIIRVKDYHLRRACWEIILLFAFDLGFGSIGV